MVSSATGQRQVGVDKHGKQSKPHTHKHKRISHGRRKQKKKKKRDPKTSTAAAAVVDTSQTKPALPAPPEGPEGVANARTYSYRLVYLSAQDCSDKYVGHLVSLVKLNVNGHEETGSRGMQHLQRVCEHCTLQLQISWVDAQVRTCLHIIFAERAANKTYTPPPHKITGTRTAVHATQYVIVWLSAFVRRNFCDDTRSSFSPGFCCIPQGER